MFGTTFLEKDYYFGIAEKALKLAPYCENRRYLANNNTFFCNMIVDDAGKVHCTDWGRAGIMDFSSTPKSVPIMYPSPPVSSVPPITAQVMTSSSAP